ncbi:MAG: ferritin-like protein [Chloroflexota bacterium]|nr:ferritin-like protein [Chloroflexota bacterium]
MSGRIEEPASRTSELAEPPHASGRLSQVLAARGEHASAEEREAPMVIEHREALIYTLGKAAELEHLVMCQYLFAAFSLKLNEREGLSAEGLEAAKRWRHTLLEIAEQEMLHLALVENLLTAVGAAPRLARPNFPLPVRSYPAGIQMVLLPFSETALRHFAYLERPEGVEMADAEGFAALEKAAPLPRADEDEIGPHLQDFDTVGHLYRSIEAGLANLAGRIGEERLFIGPPAAQATETHFRWKELVAVTNLASARAALEIIVEQGEGARGDWRDAHFGRLIAILDEYVAARGADPAFEPTRPVVAAWVRQPEVEAHVPIITEPFTVRLMDLLNAVVEVLLQMLSRYFAHTDETEEQLGVLADLSVGLMYEGVKPLGGMVTRLPIGPDYPGLTAGPAFELFYAVDYLLPHREAAWLLMEERLRDVAELATRCRDACIPEFMVPLSKVTNALRSHADRLAAAR